MGQQDAAGLGSLAAVEALLAVRAVRAVLAVPRWGRWPGCFEPAWTSDSGDRAPCPVPSQLAG